MRRWTPVLALLVLLGVVPLLAGLASGTPLYAARAGRACDTCHLTPNTWKNPGLAERKCSLSCQTCHVDPAGGGQRNATGRFYGRATLPMVATGPRPTADWDRLWGGLLSRHDRATTYTNDLPLGPDDLEAARDTAMVTRDFWGRGKPVGSPSAYSRFPGRYGVLNADPLLRLGWDLRIAALSSDANLYFPMQADLSLAVHPVEHVTAFANVGARGRTTGTPDVIDDPETPYLREGFILLHEAPYQAYLKAGRFVPAYGLRLDDHTSFIRRQFDLDASLPETRVTGVEVGLAPNFPYLNLSWFRTKAKTVAPDAFDIFDFDAGSGGALNLGYREVGWGVGASAMIRRRPLDEGGDARTFGVYGTVSPFTFSRKFPVTYQVEVDHGIRERLSGEETSVNVFYQELDWLVGNGLNLLAKHDWEDPDTEVKDDEAHRVSLGAQFTPVPGVTLDCRGRMLFPAGGRSDVDLFLQLHLWN